MHVQNIQAQVPNYIGAQFVHATWGQTSKMVGMVWNLKYEQCLLQVDETIIAYRLGVVSTYVLCVHLCY
jgi:hypothetical protein